MTWTSKTKQVEVWTEVGSLNVTFSALVFSHAQYNGVRIFSFKSIPGT